MPALRTRDTQPRALEVTPAIASSVAIVAPTPRAFTFPIAHNLADSPYSSPSSSPFEPENYASSSSSSNSSIRTLSPPALDLVGHRQRLSTSLEDAERRPRKGDEDYIKRPENAFMLFRRKCVEDHHAAQDEAKASTAGPVKKKRQADLSKTISQKWKSLTEDQRTHWDELAKQKKREHAEQHPGYVYRPERRNSARASSKKGKAKKGEMDLEGTNCISFVMPMGVPRNHGRSASAPTPPPTYQAIQVPNVYSTPSCPSSPSLGPLISQFSSRPGESIMTFDYHPPAKDNVAPPPPFSDHEAVRRRHEGNPIVITDVSSQLAPLTVSPDSLFLPNQFPPPPSPTLAPTFPPHSDSQYTPLTNSLASAYAQLSEHGFIDAQTQAEIDGQMQMQEFGDYNPYGWEATTLWPTGSDMMVNEDFDINAIQPVSIDLKSQDGAASSGSDFGHDYMAQDYPPSQGYLPNPYQVNNSLYPDDSSPYDVPSYDNSQLQYDEMMPPHGY
ncbi:hypothetical protein CYLTODRAFT_397357 [Cylindrobasidium torrendii FP15055 ss-10]|uniref:HMG box domain-containing protein n=1 Tax=Cylindrobasidium torrendii FP15055 ss-10 TaxID=1314674 RepID=A0A0D7B9Y4_9AGAR|nr:hypothetical protein CYLTODRAFT_397357 [Cylindrobasidium torrendii FP15055 ss-10]